MNGRKHFYLLQRFFLTL
uniref:Uncharacterized protein n=1 Tax=Anguilla anguilla TaxID=7936 RepID=A0A0E9QBL1_ANGAN